MFESLRIKGFQPHIDLRLDFDSLITTLTGPSDSGKSAIIRALRWLCLNKVPKNHINFESTTAYVKLKVDGHTIIRKQSKKDNLYILDGKKHKAFSKSVPEEVSNILKVHEINFQRQLESHFWFSLPSSQVSKEINKLVELDVIDRASSNIGAKLRKTRMEVEISENRIKQAIEEVESLDWVRTADDELRKIERLNDDLIGMQSCVVSLRSLINDISEHKRLVQDDGERIGLIEKVVFTSNKLEETRKTQSELLLLVDNIMECQQESSIEVPDSTEFDTKFHELTELKMLVSQIQVIKDEICRSEKEIEILNKTIEKEIGALAQCPLCGTSMKKK